MASRVFICTLVSVLFAPACVADLELGETEGDPGSTGSTSVGDSSDGGGDISATVTVGSAEGGDDAIPTDASELAETFATARCAAMQACSCFLPEDRWFDVELCETDIRESLLARAQSAFSFGLHVDPGCWALQRDVLVEGGCTPSGAQGLFDTEVAAYCPLFVGEGAEGEPCEGLEDSLFGDNTCAAGMVCDAGTCTVMPTLGETCLETLIGCDLDYTCVNGTCAERMSVGETCDLWSCEIALRCDDEGVCAPRTEPGAACRYDFECASSRCRDEVCAPEAAALCGPYQFEEPPE